MTNKNSKQASRKVAKNASGLLKNAVSGKKVKSVAGSALAHTKTRKKK
jgi:hypothetical protein